ncbi:hypothetical protein ABK905_02110 [Acerihabitans sp. KWT182]|uniref:Uncharacterized protein n=1 Tax=Acerihabitans sp. KWT182 TaxID=3157919 RepID=A0AAU7QAC8_9GAMM
MPVSSIDNHRRTIGIYYHRQQKKCKSQLKIDMNFRYSRLEEHKLLPSLEYVGNEAHAYIKKEKIVTKQLRASSLLNVAILLMSLKPEQGIHNLNLSTCDATLLSSYSTSHHQLDTAIAYGSISLIDVIPLHQDYRIRKNAGQKVCRRTDEARAKKQHKVPPKAVYGVADAGDPDSTGSRKINRTNRPLNNNLDKGGGPSNHNSVGMRSGMTQFINPMKVHHCLFGHEKVDHYGTITRNVKNFYRTEDVCIRYLKDQDRDIPHRFYHLKNNIGIFREEIRIAQATVGQALLKFKRTTEKNDLGFIKYHPENGIKAYLERVLETDDEGIIYHAMVRLEYYLMQVEKYFREHKGNIIFATGKRKNSPDAPFRDPMVGFTMPMDSRNRIVIMVDYFGTNEILHDRLRFSMLNDNSSILVGSRNFVYSPNKRRPGDIDETLEVFNEDTVANGKEAVVFDDLTIKSYADAMDREVDVSQFLMAIKK